MGSKGLPGEGGSFMAATISGVVFSDLNHNGIYDSGEPGIGGTYVYLSSSAGLVEAVTDAGGNYQFTVTAPGTYTVYETVLPNSVNPPVSFGQPAGFTMSNGPRKSSVTVNAANITGGAVLQGGNFGHDTNAAPVVCSTDMIQFVGTPTEWVNINLVTGNPTMAGLLTPADYVNAIGYNVLDFYLYGYDVTVSQLVRVDGAGNIMYLGNPVGLPVTANGYNSGGFDANGILYLYYNNLAKLYAVNLVPDSPNFMRLVDPTATPAYSEQTSNYGLALNNTLNIADLIWLPAIPETGTGTNGFIYGIQNGGTVSRINLDNLKVVNLTTSGPTYNNSFGALSVDFNNNIYAIANQNGNIYRYVINGMTATGTYFSNTYYAAQNDGAMCRLVQLAIDFGDAPDTGIGNGPGNYNTLLANNGPRHEVVPGLMLGTQVTAEEDAYQNSDATGDDLSLGIPDDGVATPLPSISPSAGSYSLTVTATNNNPKAATLYGWVDFNQNGLFEVSELATALVPANSGTASYILNFTVSAGTQTVPGNTFVRLRLTTDSLVSQIDPIGQDGASVGPAGDGEVEDYVLAIAPIADLQISKTASADSAKIGDSLTYSILIQNLGPDIAQNILLVDSVPTELNNPQYSIDGGVTWQTGTGALAIPDLSVGGSFNILIRGVVNNQAAQDFSNTATVTSTTEDPDLSNNSSSVGTQFVPSANLAITKVADSNTLLAGQTQPLTYTLVISNAGPNDAQSVSLTDPVPDELDSPLYSLDQITWQPWTGTLDLGTLPAGASINVYIQGQILANATQDLVNTATVTSPTDPNSHQATITNPLQTSADLAIVKTSDAVNNKIIAGEVITYSLAITNNGPSDAQQVLVEDTDALGLLTSEANVGGAGWIPWTGTTVLEELDAGQSITIQIRGTVDPTAEGLLVNGASVSSPTPDPDPSNNSSSVTTAINQSADLAIVKTANTDDVNLNNTVYFDLQVNNYGPDMAKNVVLSDGVPPELTDVQYTLDGSTWQPWTGSLNVGNLAVNSQLVVQIKGTVDTALIENITNTATIVSDTPDPDPTNNTSSVQLHLNDPADLAMEKSLLGSLIGGSLVPGSAVTGTEAVFALVVSNLSTTVPSTALTPTITDDLPAGFLNPEYSLDQTNWQPWTGSYTMTADLSAGETFTLYLKALVDPALDPETTASLSNTATVSSVTPDDNPGNNSSQIQVPITASADLEVTKVLQSPLVAGTQAEYQLQVTNLGPSTAAAVTLQDVIPSRIAPVTYSLDGSTWMPWTNTSLLLGTMIAGQSQMVYFQGLVGPSATGTIINSALVYSPTPDPDATNNHASTSDPITAACFLNIIKTAYPNPVAAGEYLTYTLVVSNNGPSSAQGVVVTDVTPPGLAGTQFSTDGGLTWNAWTGSYAYAGAIPANGARTLLIKGLVTEGAASTMVNTAMAGSPSNTNPDAFSTSTVTIMDEADLEITKVASINHIQPGDLLKYAITVTNLGPSDGDSVVISDNPPTSLLDVQYTTADSPWAPWTGSLAIGDLGASDTFTITLQGTVAQDAEGEIINSASVSSLTPDPNPTNNSSSYEVIVNQSADVSVKKTALGTSVVPGQTLTYVLIVSNGGPGEAENVTVSDLTGTWFLDPEVSLDGGATWSPWNFPYPLGTLAAGQQVTLQLQGQVAPDFTGPAVNQATVVSPTPDPNPANNSSVVTLPVLIPQADLSLVKTCPAGSAVPGQLLTYVLTASNAGPDAASNTQVADSLGGWFLDPEVSLDNGVTWEPWVSPYSLGTLDGGQEAVLLLQGTVDPSFTGPAANTATITSSTPDPDPSNNSSSITVPVPVPPPLSADISILKTCLTEPAVPGQPLVYSLVAANAGPDTAASVTLADSVPEQLQDPQYSLDGVDWLPWPGSLILGDLAADASVTVLLQGTLAEEAGGYVSNSASVSSPTQDPDPTNNSYTSLVPIPYIPPVPPVVPAADLTLSKTADQSIIQPGSLLTYTLSITNNGPDEAENILLTDSLPAALGTPLYSTDNGTNWNSWTGSLNLGSLPSSGVSNVLIQCTVAADASQYVSNSAVVTSDTPDPDPSNNTSTLVTPIPPTACKWADLSVSKTADQTSLKIGDSVTYTIVVANYGPDLASGVVLTDGVQSTLANPESSVDGGQTWVSWNGNLGLGDLAAGAELQVLIRGTVENSGAASNTITVMSSTADPNPENNSSVSTTPMAPHCDLSIIATTKRCGCPRQPICYTVTVKNSGPEAASQVMVRDADPDEICNMRFSMDQGRSWQSWDHVLCLPQLEANTSVTFHLTGTVRCTQASHIMNVFMVSSVTADTNPSNNVFGVRTKVCCR